MSDSKRLSSPGEGDALERALLASAEIPEPTAAVREAIWSALAARLAAAAPPVHGVEGGTGGEGLTAAGKAGLSIVTKLALVSVGCIVVASAVAGARALRPATGAMGRDRVGGDRIVLDANGAAPGRGGPPSHALDEPGAVAGPSDIAPDPQVAPPSRLVPSPVASPRTSAAPRAAGSPSSAARRAAPPSRAPSEASLLLAARSSLRAGSCAGALSQLDDMARRFPEGLFAEEREAMAIEALDCSGRGAEAADRAARFLRDHPASPYADLVRSRL